MAPLPTIGNCVRFTINWSQSAGVRPVNVLHLITSSTDEEEIAGAFSDAVLAAGADVFDPVQDGYTIDSYTVTLLDGSSAAQVINEPATIGGQASGDPIPAVAAVLSLRTAQRGPRGRGRLYLGPVGEGITAGGVLTGTTTTSTVAAWTALMGELATGTPTMSLGVASYVHSEVNGVSSVSMRPQVGTMRRRQDQLV